MEEVDTRRWIITIDYLMIIAKYFISPIDFINAMKVCKKYKELVLMYKFNPISNADLFPFIETQHFYEYRDVFYRKRDMFKYVYWIKPYLLEEYLKLIDDSRCVVKDVFINKAINHCTSMGFQVGKVYKSNVLGRFIHMRNGHLVMNYHGTYFIVTLKDAKASYRFGKDITVDNIYIGGSVRFPNKRIYLRTSVYSNNLITLNEKSNVLELELEENVNHLKDRLPNLCLITDYVLIEN